MISLRKAFVIVTLLFLVLLTACSSEKPEIKSTYSDNSELLLLNLEDVVSIQVNGGLPMLSSKQALLLNMNNPKDKDLITKVVTWLNNSRQINGQVNYGRHGYPNTMKIKLKDGEINIEPAYNCYTKKFDNGGSQTTCVPTKGEVVFEVDKANEKYGGLKSVKRTRLKSPELYSWLQGGWKK